MPTKTIAPPNAIDLKNIDPNYLKSNGFTEIRPGFFYKGHSTIQNRMRVPHGYGDMVYSLVRSRYIGNWVNGNFHGEGILYEVNRVTYAGRFNNNAKHGPGAQQTANGDILEGNWNNDSIMTPYTIIMRDGTEVRMDTESFQKVKQDLNKIAPEIEQFAGCPLARYATRVSLGALPPDIQKIMNSEEMVRGAIHKMENNDRANLDEAYAKINQLLVIKELDLKEKVQLAGNETEQRHSIYKEESQNHLAIFSTWTTSYSAMQAKLLKQEASKRPIIEQSEATAFKLVEGLEKAERISSDKEAFRNSTRKDPIISPENRRPPFAGVIAPPKAEITETPEENNYAWLSSLSL